MTIHSLKCWPEPFAAILSGRKTFEIRQEADRRFEPEDVLVLREWNPETAAPTGRVLIRVVGYVARAAWGLPDGMVVMSLLRPGAGGWWKMLVERLRGWVGG